MKVGKKVERGRRVPWRKDRGEQEGRREEGRKERREEGTERAGEKREERKRERGEREERKCRVFLTIIIHNGTTELISFQHGELLECSSL